MMQSQTMTKAVDETGADHRGVQTLAAEYECIITLLKQLFFFFSFSGAAFVYSAVRAHAHAHAAFSPFNHATQRQFGVTMLVASHRHRC